MRLQRPTGVPDRDHGRNIPTYHGGTKAPADWCLPYYIRCGLVRPEYAHRAPLVASAAGKQGNRVYSAFSNKLKPSTKGYVTLHMKPIRCKTQIDQNRELGLRMWDWSRRDIEEKHHMRVYWPLHFAAGSRIWESQCLVYAMGRLYGGEKKSIVARSFRPLTFPVGKEYMRGMDSHSNRRSYSVIEGKCESLVANVLHVRQRLKIRQNVNRVTRF